jgi:hypothetical protein
MRFGLFALSLLGVSLFSAPGHADPYRWCVVYGGNGGESCYFKTLEECRAAITFGGECNPNASYSEPDSLGRHHHAIRYH